MNTTDFLSQDLFKKYPDLYALEADWHLGALYCCRQAMFSGTFCADSCCIVIGYIEKVLGWIERNESRLEEDSKLAVAMLKYEAEKQHDRWSGRLRELRAPRQDG